MKITGRNIFVIWVIAMVTVVAIGGMILSGAPAKERARRIDQQRVSDLQSISSAIDQVYNNPTDGGKLPAKLEDLRQRRDVYLSSLVDPESQLLYTYRVTGDESYQLCAIFKTNGVDDAQTAKSNAIYPMNGGSDFWKHEAGEKCFDFKVTKWNAVKPVIN